MRDPKSSAASPRAASALGGTRESGASPPADPLAFARTYLATTADVVSRIDANELADLIGLVAEARQAKRHIFICGNGGSATTASHFAAGLGKDGSYGRPERFRTLALTDNVAWLTALANDAHYSQVFVEQLRNFASKGDLLITFSSSGNSENVIRAVEWANDNDLVTVGVTGSPGGALAALAQRCLVVDSPHIGYVEDAHFVIQHLVSYYFIEGA
ncbi:MAG: SIS domain-containing protein [Candidatus Binatia bacterium]